MAVEYWAVADVEISTNNRFRVGVGRFGELRQLGVERCGCRWGLECGRVCWRVGGGELNFTSEDVEVG